MVSISEWPPAVPPTPPPSVHPPLPRERPLWLGRAALLAAAVVVVLEIIAIVIGTFQLWFIATVLAYAVIGLSLLPVVGGVVAVAASLGRPAGVAAIVLGVLANPLVQLGVLRLLGSS